jgi:hypothetical protein
MHSQQLGLVVLLVISIVGTNACRRQVTVSQNSTAPVASAPTPEQYHHDAGPAVIVPQTKFFKGSIGSRQGLQMKLTRDGEHVVGSYSYQNVGSKIELKGTIDKDNNLVLEEFDSGGKQSGVFKGTWLTDVDGLANLAGNWSNPNNEKKTAFSLHEEPIEFTGAVELAAKQLKENNKKLNYQIDAQYPQTTGAVDNRFDKFNQEAKSLVIRHIGEFKKQAAAVPSEGTADPAAQPASEDKSTTPGSTLDIGYNVALAKDDLISIQFDLGSYSAGAAHPNSVSAVLNYDLKAGKALKLADLFTPGAKFLQAISSYCVKDLKKQSQTKVSLLDDQSIQSGAGPDMKNYQSWTITRKGLQITFDAYQVGPYAAGPQSVVIPYSALKDLIKIDGPLVQFVK